MILVLLTGNSTKSSRDVITQNSQDTMSWLKFLRLIFAWFPSSFSNFFPLHFTIGKSSSMSWFPFPWSLNGTWFSITSIFPSFYLSPPHNLRFFPLPFPVSRMVFVCPGSVGSWWRKLSRSVVGSGSWTSTTHDGSMEKWDIYLHLVDVYGISCRYRHTIVTWILWATVDRT